MCLQPALHEAVQEPGNSSNPPFPPSLKKMMDLAERPALTRDQKMLVAYANLTVARYFLHHEDVPQVSVANRNSYKWWNHSMHMMVDMWW